MSEMTAKKHVQQATIEAVVIRSDGTREELGVVAYWHRHWWRRLLWRLRYGHG